MFTIFYKFFSYFIFSIIIGTSLGLLLSINIDVIENILSFLLNYDLWNNEVRYLSTMPYSIQINDIIFIISISLISSLLASYIPILRIFKINLIWYLDEYNRIKKISKSYKTNIGSFEILKNINFKIDKKKSIFLFGPSGCGKSTLLNIITGLDVPDKGSILYEGKPIKENHMELLKRHWNYLPRSLFDFRIKCFRQY